jgi:thymidylate kinase
MGAHVTGSFTAEAEASTARATGSIHPVLARAFIAFNEAGIEWCLLRGGANLADPGGDVDLLVGPRHLRSATEILESLGARQHRSWGRGSHRFFVNYDAPSSRWLKFDLVSELAFDPRQAVAGPPADGLLARRQPSDIVWGPSRADAFWLLLLHSILDKSAFGGGYRGDLTDLVDDALDGAPELRAWVDGLVPPGWNAGRVAELVRRGAWDQLLAIGRSIRRRSARRHPGAFLSRTLLAVALRRAGRLVGLLAVRPPVIALVGPDGSGKSSVARRLTDWWPGGGRVVHLGLYARSAGGGPLLRGWRLVRARVTTRYELLRGRLVVFDRHPIEDPDHQAGFRRRARGWVIRALAPRPTRVVLLDAPAEELHRRRPDHDTAWLARKREEFRQLAETNPLWVVVDATRDLDAVTTTVAAIAWSDLHAEGTPPRMTGADPRIVGE